jgi:hypothetical protein
MDPLQHIEGQQKAVTECLQDIAKFETHMRARRMREAEEEQRERLQAEMGVGEDKEKEEREERAEREEREERAEREEREENPFRVGTEEIDLKLKQLSQNSPSEDQINEILRKIESHYSKHL